MSAEPSNPPESTSDQPTDRRSLAVARRPADPLRFGTRALLGVTAICGLQFALMSYLGVMVGLVLGLVACLGVLALVMAAGLVWGNSPASEARFDRIVIQFTLMAALLFAGTIVAGGGMAAMHLLRLSWISRGLHRDLGFKHRTDYIFDGNRGRQAILITAIESGGLFEQANVKQGDAILTELSPGEYLEMLDRNRGGVVTITVVSATPSRSIESAPRRQIEVRIPSRAG